MSLSTSTFADIDNMIYVKDVGPDFDTLYEKLGSSWPNEVDFELFNVLPLFHLVHIRLEHSVTYSAALARPFKFLNRELN